MEKFNNKLEDLVNTIKESDEYKKCIELKESMKDNTDITERINKIKTLQKKYIKSNYDEKIKEELDIINKELLDIPIYSIYNYNLEKVNIMIEFVKDSLNDYFYNLLNN